MDNKTFKQILTTQIPIAWIAGVRLESAAENEVKTYVELDFLNQNPFKSMFWAAQGMAAEMPTGILVMKAIRDSKQKISMLVTHQEAYFYKKATGKITFTCSGGKEIRAAINESIKTGEGQLIVLTATGINEDGIEVSKFHFHWSIKVKS